MKFNPSFLSKILVIVTLALSPSLDLHSQVSAEDVKRSLILACNEVSLGENSKSFKEFSKACKGGDCVKAAEEHLTYQANKDLVKEIHKFCNASFLESIDLNKSSSEVAKDLLAKIKAKGKIKTFLDKPGKNRRVKVEKVLIKWLDEFTPSPTPTPSNPSTSKGNSNTKDAWPLDDPNGPADEATEEDGSVEEGDKKSGGNFVFILIILLLLGAIGLLAFLYYKLNMEKEALEQSSKRLRDESAQFNAEQYKLKRLLSERERQLRTLMEEGDYKISPPEEVETEDSMSEPAPEEPTEESSAPPMAEPEVTSDHTVDVTINQEEANHEEVEPETPSTEESDAAHHDEPEENPGHVSYPPNVEGQRSVLFFSAPNAQGEFPSSTMMRDYSPEAVIRVFLRSENADYGEFQVVTNPTSQRQLLANWEHTLAHFAVPVNPEHPEPRSIELERPGGIRESEGVWKVVRKAKVRFM